MQAAFRAVVEGELAKHGISEAEKAVNRFKLIHTASERGDESTDTNMNGGLEFSVSAVGACLDTLEMLEMDEHAKVRMAAVSESL